MTLKEQIEAVYATANSSGYPELVRKLIAIGVESYTVEVATATILYRFAAGNNVLHIGGKIANSVSDNFQKEAILIALQNTQQGKTTYPQFLKDIAEAGVRFYEATLSGDNKRVTYIGAGGSYEENIPL